ncbi:retrovirus-related Pol polyprotein from transposon TNT 1-94 [Lactuca sativa]|uniref:retrovirus-related Pol polyprotein from transposon TNT 1-94 n=1 Tax=Lactuca sativa TaxID=4236 RepID=UPI0022AF6591|nr:retrovirus-related Pol polyprotein from transposon TNT 1-94 [Lactuca sativa]
MSGSNGEKDGQVTLHYPMLSRSNYAAWAIKMRVFMQAQGVWEAVEPRTANTVVEVKKDKLALAAIYQGIPEDLLLSLAEKKTAKEAWDALKTMFMGADRVRTARIQTLKYEFESLNMKETEGVDEFAVKVINIVSTMRTLGDTVDESYVVKKLLRAVPAKFLQIASTLEQFADLDEMTVEEVIGRLKAHEERMKGHGDTEERKLLLTHQEWTERNKKKGEGSSKSAPKGNRGSRGRGRGRGRGGPSSGRGGRGRGGSHQQKERSQNGGHNQDKSDIQCYNCQEFGHYAAECKNPRKERNYESNLIQEDNEPALLLSSLEAKEEAGEVFLNEENVNPKLRSNGDSASDSNMWYLDTGASNHMTGNRSKFQELDTTVQGTVRFGNNSKVRIEGKGRIAFQCKNGEQRKLEEVYYIPDLCSNIISLGQLDEGGDEIRIKQNILRIYDSKMRLLMKVQRSSNRLYKIELREVSSRCLVGESKDPTWLWHTRLGHVNFTALKSMSEKGIIEGVPKMAIPSKPCEGCLVGKQSRSSFPASTNYRAKKKLELVHGDLCGPVSPPTPAGNIYFMLLVDDYSRVMWVFFIKTKDEAFRTFTDFRSKVENETGEKLKMLRTDRGGEFLSKKFEEYCSETGLERQYTAPYSPQQNGVVERRNRTVLEMARSCLKAMMVPDALWGEAVSHAVYVLNRLSTKALDGTTPYEIWTGRKPHVGHLRVFGCVAHMKIAKNHLKKLEDRSKKVVYLGTEKGSKAHRLLDPNTGAIYVSRDVIFEENRRWEWEKSLKIKSTPGISFTIEGFDFSEEHYSDEGDWVSDTSEYVSRSDTVEGEIEEPNNNDIWADSTQPINPTPNLSPIPTPINTPPGTPIPPSTQNSSTHVATPSTGSSSTGGGAPKRYRLLSDLYENTNEIELPPEELMLVSNEEEPASYDEARRKKEWVQAMNDEMASIEKNDTWNLVDLPKGRRAIGLKWVFKVKRDPQGNILKHKARIVAKGYIQKQGIDYEEVFAPVARIETVRVILALAGSNGWRVHHLDVKSAFLNGHLTEEVYVSQPEGFVKKNEPGKVYKLSKALYGLKQAPRAWNSCLDKYLKSLGFRRCAQEYSVYTRTKNGSSLIIGIYVDDLLVTGSNPENIKEFKKEMKARFEMSDLGLLSYYLGIEVNQQDKGITLKQEGYAKNILIKTRMIDCNPTKTPMEHKLSLTKDGNEELVNPTEYRSIVGCLRYLTHTRPDITFAVGVVSRFMEKPTIKHLQAVKGILRYVKGTLSHGLVYSKEEEKVNISGYTDSDLAKDINDRRSTGGMAFYVNGNLVTWASQKQRVVALSSCEAEFIAATMAACQGIWLRRLLTEITGQKVPPVTLFVDNQSALDLMKNPVFHGRSKHIDIRYHFIRECVENGEITVKHVSGKSQKADILTKSLARVKHEEMRDLVGVMKIQN